AEPLSPDRQVAQKMFGDVVRRLERERGGIVTPEEVVRRDHHERQIDAHVRDYLAALKAEGVSDAHHRERGRLLNLAVKAMRATRLRDVTKEKLNEYLAGLACGARTKQTYRGAVVYFYNWLAREQRVAHNWLAGAAVPKPPKGSRPARCRRALTVEELQRVLDAARMRPLHERLKVNRGPNKGQPLARLGEGERQRLALVGRE